MVNAVLFPSRWTLPEARSLAAQLRHTATTAAEYDGLELFGALTEYLDDLYGGAGFDRLLPEPERTALAGRIQAVRGRSGPAPVELDEHGVPVDLSATEADPRLDQPVNAAVTLLEGRRLAAELATAGDWQGELGGCLQALYTYLDQLYGGPGAFTELLTPEERAQVAAGAPSR
ncbi:hypothetical protein Kfla_3289 [Kribbella flavida DSM 17836]|uniref:Uncharacterized protein n=1 Tax=Kribbella flavida (strain DSM 17836 / JCM 10339 / NBRC 14399) TaxID=479435 RepID=D2Q4N6_KRIFD|nr:hypothetical protein Kfla_3289 [Kribbella flavida DSM 17836]